MDLDYCRVTGICVSSGVKELMITGLGIHREVGLSLQNAVNHASAVSVRGVVGVRGRQLDDGCTWEDGKRQRRAVRKYPSRN